MNKLLLTIAIGAGCFLASSAELFAQPRVNPNLYRQNLVRPAIAPLPAYRTPVYNTFNNFYQSYYTPSYVAPVYNPYAVYPDAYYPNVYPNYYQSAWPSYYNPYSYNPYAYNPWSYYPW